MTVGSYVRRSRQRLDMSLRTLADMVGVDAAYLSRVERDMVPASQGVLEDLSCALGLDRDALVLLSGKLPQRWQPVIDAAPTDAIKTIDDALALSIAESAPRYSPSAISFSGTRAIEDSAFPFERFSDIAELESWRKEIYRPIYHVHKWWAQRLGTVFRSILIACFAPKGSNVLEMFYEPVRLPGAVVFDPFMGSGTTLGETLKLGGRAIGRDINPVACLAVQNGLGAHDREQVIETYRSIERDVAESLKAFYKAQLSDGSLCDVLYYFWVKIVSCPKCHHDVDLFSSYVFARHAYPDRHPEAHAVCPNCGDIKKVNHSSRSVTCSSCSVVFDPSSGPAKGATVTCTSCRHTFSISKAVQQMGKPPAHRMYAKMVLRSDGSKEYLPVDEYDLASYRDASRLVREREHAFPVAAIEPGYNTDQVLGYCYSHWHQMFNGRQLLCLSLLAERIRAISDERIRELFACLFSGVLEFNNMFASFKGEGTGAVRHMFSHHILKPERTPLEANVWGTPKSSGSFSTLFETRILRSLDYRSLPFETRVTHKNGKQVGAKVYGLSRALGDEIAGTFSDFAAGRDLYLSCGDSASTDLPAECVDAVVTDPPFFDNVHYSQLADFFYVWQQYILSSDRDDLGGMTTRSSGEVQHSDPETFSKRLTVVWQECNRVLRPDGLLVFTYHHSKPEGWHCLLRAIWHAGFCIVATHPIKAEMSGAQPKHQAKEPIDLDIVIVCRKRQSRLARLEPFIETVQYGERESSQQVSRFNSAGRRLSRNDVRIVLMSQLLKRLSQGNSVCDSLNGLKSGDGALEAAIERLHRSQIVNEVTRDDVAQLGLL